MNPNPHDAIWRLENRRFVVREGLLDKPAFTGSVYQAAEDAVVIVARLRAVLTRIPPDHGAADITNTVIGMLTLFTQLLSGDVGVVYTEDAIWEML